MAWCPLDVLRWQLLEIDVGGVEDDTEVYRRIREAISDAVDEAEERLLAARIVLTGATALHGKLHRNIAHLQAEVLGLVQDFGSESVWVEKIKLKTMPVYDLEKLAERDALTKVVLETLEDGSKTFDSLPADVASMLEVLPVELRAEITEEWEGSGQTEVMGDVQAIIIDGLQTKGGE